MPTNDNHSFIVGSKRIPSRSYFDYICHHRIFLTMNLPMTVHMQHHQVRNYIGSTIDSPYDVMNIKRFIPV